MRNQPTTARIDMVVIAVIMSQGGRDTGMGCISGLLQFVVQFVISPKIGRNMSVDYNL